MKIGYYVQGAVDQALIEGLARRWCPQAQLAEGVFRGSSKESFRREIRKALIALRDVQGCDVLVVLTDSDVNPWREVKQREAATIPRECDHQCAFGVAERNIECWLCIDPQQIAVFLQCEAGDIPADDPSGFVKRRLGMGERDEERESARERVRDFVTNVRLKPWIDNSDSFAAFYDDIRRLAARIGCAMANERAASS